MTVAEQKRRAALGFIVCLGVVSLFADMTYEGAHSSIGPYLRELGASAAAVSVIAGLGEMLAASLRFFSGRLASRTHAYWTITLFGYAMNVIAVPALAFAGRWEIAAALVIAERTGKALRGPARDVLLSEATEQVGHGFGFGLHSIMDQTGAVVGPVLMMLAVARSGEHFGPAFLWLVYPAAGTLTALTVARILHPTQGASARNPGTQVLPRIFWPYVAAAGLLAFGYTDFPLLAVHFVNRGFFDARYIPLLYAGAMAVEGAAAFVFGKMFDRIGLTVLVIGTLVSLLSLPLGYLGGSSAAIAAVGCWGIGIGAQDATLRSGIAQVVSMNKRGNAFGVFNGVFGVMWFLGSVAMGLLYSRSLYALVALGVAAQAGSAVLFLVLRRPLEQARSTA